MSERKRENTPSNWYKEEFERRLSQIPSYLEKNEYLATEFNIDAVGIFPDMLTAAYLAIIPKKRYELLIGCDHPGYFQGDHGKVLLNYGFTITDNPFDVIFPAFYFEEGTNRYLMVCNLQLRTNYFDKQEIARLAVAMGEYEITTVFTAVRESEEDYLLPNGPTIQTGDHLNLIDRLIRDDYISGIAQKFGWTNNEMLRFRLNWEFPEWKKPSKKSA